MAATMKDIAKQTGLGLATISKYLNGGQVLPNNKKLMDNAVRGIHFIRNEFARGLKTSQRRTIGVLPRVRIVDAEFENMEGSQLLLDQDLMDAYVADKVVCGPCNCLRSGENHVKLWG